MKIQDWKNYIYYIAKYKTTQDNFPMAMYQNQGRLSKTLNSKLLTASKKVKGRQILNLNLL